MIKAVLFDVDGVLLDSFEANLKFYQDLLPVAGYEAPSRKTFSRMFHMTMTDVIRKLINKDEEEVKRVWIMGKNRVVKYPDHLLSFPEGMGDVIIKLSKKYLLGIVTSRIRGGLFKIPKLAELEKDFKTVVYYEDTEKHKPDPAPLLLAANRLGINPCEALYIGDTESDLKAAKNAGMKILIFSKNKFREADANTFVFAKIPKIMHTL